jgi:hypothetical protein
MVFLREKRVDVMDWPGNSPNLNPIENLWSIMKKKLKEDHTITSLNKLQDAIKKMWVQLPNDLMMKLAQSMPRRLRMCIENKGQMTKY